MFTLSLIHFYSIRNFFIYYIWKNIFFYFESDTWSDWIQWILVYFVRNLFVTFVRMLKFLKHLVRSTPMTFSSSTAPEFKTLSNYLFIYMHLSFFYSHENFHNSVQISLKLIHKVMGQKILVQSSSLMVKIGWR